MYNLQCVMQASEYPPREQGWDLNFSACPLIPSNFFFPFILNVQKDVLQLNEAHTILPLWILFAKMVGNNNESRSF